MDIVENFEVNVKNSINADTVDLRMGAVDAYEQRSFALVPPRDASAVEGIFQE